MSSKITEMTRLLVKYWWKMGQENQTVQQFERQGFLIIQENFSIILLTEFAGYKPLHEQ